MLISVSNLDLSALSDGTEDSILKIQVITNLLLANFQRKHVIVFNRRELAYIVDEPTLFGIPARTHAQDIQHTIMGAGGLLSTIDIRVEVNFVEHSEYNIINRDNKCIISINYKKFLDPEFLNTPILLGEHLNDAKLYYKFSELYLKITRLFDGIKINLSPDHGGGSSTIDKFRYLTESNRMCFCILDSDKKFPEDIEKDTSRAFRTRDRVINNLSKSTVLDAHEIESIIPIKIVEDMIIHKRYDKNYIDRVDIVNKIGAARKYFDHKNGIELKQAIEIKRDFNSDFWMDVFNNIFDVDELECYKANYCHVCDDCKKIDGLGDNVLSNVVDYIYNTSGIVRYKKSVDEELLSEWKMFANDVICFGAALSHQAAYS